MLLLLLVAIALGSVLNGLSLVLATFALIEMIGITLLGLIISWLLAKSSWSGWRVTGLLTVLGLIVIFSQIDPLTNELLNLGQSFLSSDISLSSSEQSNLTELLTTIITRYTTWIEALWSDNPNFDPMVTTSIWHSLLWGIAAWAGWGVRRQANPLLALAPAGTLLVITMAHTNKPPTPLLFFLGALILLLGLVSFNLHEGAWQNKHYKGWDEAGVEVYTVIIPTTLVVVILAGMIIITPLKSVNQFIWQFIWRDNPPHFISTAQALGLMSQPGENVGFDAARLGGLPRSHLLGGGPELSEQVMLVIDVDSPAASQLYYWRSITYDQYIGQGWTTSPTESVLYQAGDPVTTALSDQYQLINQTVEVVGNVSNLLHATGEVITANQDIRVAQRSQNDIFGANVEARTYQVESRLPIFSEADLRRSDTTYPDEIQARYLALPDTIPDRVTTLAHELTNNAPTAYDKAKALESYLRTFPYSLDLPPPPEDQDIVDYFLFDLQQGYCDYYATSMVTLARSIGLPARLAIGYVHGTYDSENQRYTVTEAEAHSWVEVYFPEYGWITFEPTGGRPAIDRSTAQQQAPPSFEPTDLQPSTTRPAFVNNEASSWLPRWLSLLVTSSLLSISLGFGLAWFSVWRLRQYTAAEAITVINRRLYRMSKSIQGSLQPEHTPYEFAAALTSQISVISSESRWQTRLMPAIDEIVQLTKLYVESLYSQKQAHTIDQTKAIELWQRLRWRLTLVWVIVVLERWKEGLRVGIQSKLRDQKG